MKTKSITKNTITINGEYSISQLLSIVAQMTVARGRVADYNDVCVLLPQYIVAAHNRFSKRKLLLSECQTLDDISASKFSAMLAFGNAPLAKRTKGVAIC